MLSLAAELGEVPRPQLDPEVRTVQRAQLVAAMEAMAGSAPDPSVPEQRSGRGAHRASPLRKLRPRSRLTKGLAAGGLTVGVAAGAFGGVAAASSDALPGDSLYGLKRGMEDIKLGMAGDAADRGGIYLDHASTRLSEARRLMERGRSGSLDHESLAEIRRALGAVHHDAGQGHRLLSAAYQEGGSLQPIQQLSSFSQSHRATWTSLRDQLPPTLFDVSDQVSEVFDAIEEEVEPLRSLLPGAPSQDDRPLLLRRFLDDQRPEQAARHGGAGLLVGVVPEGAGPVGAEAVHVVPSGRDGVLGDPGHAVLGVGDVDAVPVQGDAVRHVAVDQHHLHQLAAPDP